MDFYLQRIWDGSVAGLWSANADGVSRADTYGAPVFPKDPGEDTFPCLKRLGYELAEFTKLDLGARQYHPRVARPYHNDPCSPPTCSPSAALEPDVLAQSCSQLSALTSQLTRICQTVHPEPRTTGVYGHDIRNLLVLACTEVEAHWRGILVANGANATDRFTTNQYVLLHQPLRLAEYSIKLAYFPWLPEIRPFSTWEKTNPTASLTWYAAYNSVKHDREKRFEEATLGAAISAVTACVVLMQAQFGYDFLRTRAELSSLFHPSAFPKWDVREVYADAGTSVSWTPVNAAF